MSTKTELTPEQLNEWACEKLLGWTPARHKYGKAWKLPDGSRTIILINFTDEITGVGMILKLLLPKLQERFKSENIKIEIAVSLLKTGFEAGITNYGNVCVSKFAKQPALALLRAIYNAVEGK